MVSKVEGTSRHHDPQVYILAQQQHTHTSTMHGHLNQLNSPPFDTPTHRIHTHNIPPSFTTPNKNKENVHQLPNFPVKATPTLSTLLRNHYSHPHSDQIHEPNIPLDPSSACLIHA